MKEKDINSLDNTTWRCQYNVVFESKYSVSQVMGYRKGRSGLMIFDEHNKYMI